MNTADIIVLSVLGVFFALAVRRLKRGGTCSCANCDGCAGCPHKKGKTAGENDKKAVAPS